jgi:branched-subunit amino acid aminotransferase/4-amino-4-deoxychorismate lyase
MNFDFGVIMSILPFDDRDGFIWMDGEMVAWRDAKTHVLTHGLHYASCVFEGERAYGGKIFKSREHSERFHNIADFLPVSIILLRELYIAGLREFLGKLQVDLPVSRGGKWKTALQMLAVTILLAQDAFGAALPETSIGTTLLYASALLAFISAVNYTRAAWPHLR